MKNITSKSVISNMINSKLYMFIITLGLVIIIIIPTIFHQVIIPSFKKEIINNILDEAKRVSYHLSNKLDYRNTPTKELNQLIKKLKDNFKIEKIHYFDNDGTVIYSTINSKIGTINKKDYFHNIVAKGEVHYTIVKKGNKSSENEEVLTNIIEIYTPILKDGKFDSAFELYFNISKEEKSFSNLTNYLVGINIFIAIVIGFILLLATYSLSKYNLKIRRFQHELKILANTDPLTNVFNRRYFYEVANRLIKLSLFDEDNISICMIDIDDFKIINDKYGHQVGDEVIKSLTSKLEELTRSNDIIARFGGEEFIILLPNTNILAAEKISQRICDTIATLDTKVEGMELSFTISIGISQHKKGQTIDELISFADKALYQAKHSGKNRVILHT